MRDGRRCKDTFDMRRRTRIVAPVARAVRESIQQHYVRRRAASILEAFRRRGARGPSVRGYVYGPGVHGRGFCLDRAIHVIIRQSVSLITLIFCLV